MALTKIKSGGVSSSIALDSPDINTPDIDGGTIDGTVIGGTTTAAISGTTGQFSGEITANGGIALGDGDELTLGDSDEFKIKHHASGYTHLQNTVGTLYIDSDSVTFRDDDGSPSNMVISQTGIDVTGTVVSDGLTSTTNASMTQLTVNGTGAIESGINFANGGTTYGQIYFNNVSPYDMSVMQQYSTGSLILGTNDTPRLTINTSGNATFTGTATFNSSVSTTLLNITGGSQLGQDYAYFKSNSTSNASLTLRKDSSGADSIDFLQLRNNGNGLIGKIEGDGDISFGAATFGGKLTVSDGGNATVAAIRFNAGLGISSPSTDQMNFITADTTRMVIDQYGGITLKTVGSATAAILAGSNLINGLNTLPSSAGTPFVVARDSGTTRSAEFGGGVKVGLNLTLADGNLVVASGHGIDFSATAGSGTSELLDDYEEGTWTPTSGVSLTVNQATYTKIGRLVHIIADIQFSASSSGSGAYISLPFAGVVNSYNSGSMNYTTYTNNVATVNLEPSGLYFRANQTGNILGYASVSSKRFIFAATYFTTL